MELPHAEPPDEIELDRARALTLRWPDGTTSVFLLETLRANCPCAECRNRRERDEAVWPKAGSPLPLAATDAKLIGNWGLGITWNDGHATGIFSWDLLRAWAEPD